MVLPYAPLHVQAVGAWRHAQIFQNENAMITTFTQDVHAMRQSAYVSDGLNNHFDVRVD